MYSYLTMEQRREIEMMYAEGVRVVDIAAKLGRGTTTIYAELKRGFTNEAGGNTRPQYSAATAQANTQASIKHRGVRLRKERA